MEPFAVQSSPGFVRPTLDLQGDLAAVLREGRVLSGEVLQTLDGGTLLIGLGRHRVPAEGQVGLQPGQRFLCQVRMEAGHPILELLAPQTSGESKLLRALRVALAGRSGGPLGELVGQLAAGLAAGLDGGVGPGGGEGAQGRLRAVVFTPPGGPEAGGGAGSAQVPGGTPGPRAPDSPLGARLAAALSASGQNHEAALAARAVAGLGEARAAAVGGELAALLLEELACDTGVGRQRLAAGLRAFLEADVARARARAGAGLAELVAAGLERLGVAASEWRALGGNLTRALPGPGLGKALERLVLVALGLRAPSEWSVVPSGSLDLKGLLFAWLASADGSAAEQVARAIETIEREQLLNLARARSGEPWLVSLPVCLGGEWATARLLVRGGRGGREGGVEGAHRLTLAVEFRHTGPVRADLAVRGGEGRASVAVRLSAAREDVLASMRGAARELEARLALGGRRVSLAFELADEAELRLERERAEIRFLREHHVLDRSG